MEQSAKRDSKAREYEHLNKDFQKSALCNEGDADTHFDFLGKLGQGSFGKVYKAIVLPSNTSLVFKPQMYVIKTIKPDSHDIVVYSLREIIAGVKLAHFNLCNFIQVFRHNQTVIGAHESFDIIMEYYPYDLATFIRAFYRKNRKFAPRTIAYIIGSILGGLAYLHSQKIIHRDIKPANIMIDCKGVVKIGDFGLCKIMDMHDKIKQRYYTNCGTPAYIAPEVQTHKYSYSCDLWSFGMLTGELLFPKWSKDQLHNTPKDKRGALNHISDSIRLLFRLCEASEEYKCFCTVLVGVLKKDGNARMSIEQCLAVINPISAMFDYEKNNKLKPFIDDKQGRILKEYAKEYDKLQRKHETDNESESDSESEESKTEIEPLIQEFAEKHGLIPVIEGGLINKNRFQAWKHFDAKKYQFVIELMAKEETEIKHLITASKPKMKQEQVMDIGRVFGYKWDSKIVKVKQMREEIVESILKYKNNK